MSLDPPIPDCRGHVGESFVGHVRPGQTVQFGSSCAVGGTHEPCMLLMTVGGTIDRAWTADDTHANPIATVCPSCAKPAQEHAAPIPASEHQTFNVQRALATREDVQDVVRSAIDHGSARGSTTHRVVIDPLASLRAEAARMLAEGHDERDVLGCFDLAMQCVRRGESIAHYTVEMFREQAAMMTLLRASELIVQANELHSARRCYHGRPAIPGACGWCAIVATRSDAS